jgi:hypothetical protein
VAEDKEMAKVGTNNVCCYTLMNYVSFHQGKISFSFSINGKGSGKAGGKIRFILNSKNFIVQIEESIS